MTSQMEDFTARVARIRSGEAASKSTIFVGPDEVYRMAPAQVSRRHKGVLGMFANALHPLAILLSFALGIFCHALAMLALFQTSGFVKGGADPDIELAKQGALAFALTMALGYLLRLRASDLTVAKSLGVVAGMLLFHNAVHLWPAAFETLFSPFWVGQVIASTDPQSLHFRGLTFSF